MTTRSAGIIVVRLVDTEPRFLLLRAYRYWDFPKGVVEAGEMPIAAAKREVEEETTLTQLDFRWGESFFETEPYAKGKVARYYLALSPAGEVRLPLNPVLGRPEHHEYRWLPYDAARALLAPRVVGALEWAHSVMGKWKSASGAG